MASLNQANELITKRCDTQGNFANANTNAGILFFSGGSAINALTRELKKSTDNSVHLVTSYDSGGSSAKLRQTFSMPAVGDLRNRLIALADENAIDYKPLSDLFNYRISPTLCADKQWAEVIKLTECKHSLLADISKAKQQVISHQISRFLLQAPSSFDLNNASIGNLILAGAYLNCHRHMDAALALLSKVLQVRGTIKAIANDNFHLCAELENGNQLIGQHKLTGKEYPPINSAISKLQLTASEEEHSPAQSKAESDVIQLIETASLICYPMGSFYSSIIANLLPLGVNQAIANNPAPKVYIPNLGSDPEQVGLTLQRSLEQLCFYLRSSTNNAHPIKQLLNYVVIDSQYGDYRGVLCDDYLKLHDIKVIDLPLVDLQNSHQYDNEKLVSTLLSLT